jgi:hypothetical protein
MNNATEATLQELLAVTQASLKNQIELKKLYDRWEKAGWGHNGNANSNGGGGGSGVAGGALGLVSKAAGPLSIVFSALSMAGSAVGKVFDVIGSIVGKVADGLMKTAGNLIDFSFAAMEGKARLSDLYAAFKDLPFFLGELASFFSKIIQYEEKLLDTYRDLTKYGVSFGGSLHEVKNMATKAYMTLDEFGRVVKNNSDVFATMGMNAEKGMRRFVDVQAEMFGPNSKVSQSLLGLGVTAEEGANVLGLMFRMQNGMMKSQNMSTAELAGSAANLIKNLDALAKMQGESREKLEQQMKEQAMDEQFKYFLDSLDPKQMEEKLAAVADAQLSGGKGAADNLKMMFMTGGKFNTAVTEAGRQYLVQTQMAGRQATEERYNAAMNFKLGSREYLESMQHANRTQVSGFNQFMGRVGTAGAAGAMMGNELMQNSALYKQANLTRRMTDKDYKESIDKALADQKKQGTGTAANLAQAEQNIKVFGSQIGNFLNTILGPLAQSLVTAGNRFTTWFEKSGWMKTFQEYGQKIAVWMEAYLLPKLISIAEWFGKAFKDISNAEPEKMWETVWKKMRDGASNIWKEVGPPLTKFWENDVKPMLVKVFEGMMDFIIAALRKNSRIAKLLFGETEVEQKDERKRMLDTGQYEKNIARIRAQYEGMSAGQKKSEYGKSVGGELEAAINDLKSAQKEFGVTPPANEVHPKDRRAGGGFVNPGRYLVGEKGPEVLNIGASGDVISNDNLNKLFSSMGQQNNLAAALNQLNSTNREILAAMRSTAENTRRTHEAARSLNGNLFLA